MYNINSTEKNLEEIVTEAFQKVFGINPDAAMSMNNGNHKNMLSSSVANDNEDLIIIAATSAVQLNKKITFLKSELSTVAHVRSIDILKDGNEYIASITVSITNKDHYNYYLNRYNYHVDDHA